MTTNALADEDVHREMVKTVLKEFTNQGFTNVRANVENVTALEEIGGYAPDLTGKRKDMQRGFVMLEAETCNTMTQAQSGETWRAFCEKAKKMTGEFRARCSVQTMTTSLLTFMIACLVAFSMPSILLLQDVAASSTLPVDMPVVFVDPLNVTSDVGDTFTVSVKIFNLSARFYVAGEQWVDGEPLPPPGESYNYSLGYLYALDMRLSWDPTVLEYISHNVRTPVEDYPEGILHQPTVTVFDTVDAEEGTYMLVQVSTPPAAPFNAPNENATVFTMAFTVKKQGKCPLNLTNHELLAPLELGHDGVSLRDEIPHWARTGQFQTSKLLTRIETIEAGAAVTGELHDPAIQGEDVTIRVNMKNDDLVKDTYNLSLYDGTTLLKKWENETLEPDAAQTLSHTLTGPDTGIHTVKAEAAILHESEARTDEMLKNFRVIYPPTLQISGPSFAAGGQTVRYTASGSLHNDPNGQILSYAWTLWGPGDTLPRDTRTGVSVNFTLPASAGGDWTIMLVVEDNYGITAKPFAGVTLSPTSELSRPAAAAYRMYVLLSVEDARAGISPMIVAAVLVLLTAASLGAALIKFRRGKETKQS